MGYVGTPGGQFGTVVPDANEDPNLPQDLLALAKAVEKRVVAIYSTGPVRDAAMTAMGPVEGMICFVQSNNHLYFWDGSAWQTITPPDVPAITSGTAAPSGGANGDVYFRV
jgi:hypothetical protein